MRIKKHTTKRKSYFRHVLCLGEVSFDDAEKGEAPTTVISTCFLK